MKGLRIALGVLACAGGVLAGAERAEAQARLCPPARGGEAVLSGARFVTASGYLDAEAQAHVSAQVRGCPAGRTDPSLAAVLTNQLYDAATVPLAFARPAGVQNGVMLVELVEIRYGDVSVRGNTFTRADYVLRRVGLEPGALADVTDLQTRLERFPEIEDIRIEADLEPGRALNTSDLILTVQEPKQFRFTTVLDNYGSQAQGIARATLAASVASLTGRRDPLSLIASGSEGTRGLALSYTTPITASGTRLTFGLSRDQSSVVNNVLLNGLDSATQTVSVTLRTPIRASEAANDFVTAGLSVTQDDAQLAPLTLVDQRVRTLTLGSSHTRRWPGRAVLTAGQTVSIGVVDDGVAGVTDRFRAYSGFAALTYRISDRFTGASQLNWQITPDLMPQSQRFAVTGPTHVRGYETSAGSANAGFVLRNQISMTGLFEDAEGWSAAPYAFFDLGQGYDFTPGGARAQGLLTSAGVGISVDFEVSPDLSLTLDAAIAKPLRSNALTANRDPVLLVQFGIRM